MTFSEATFGGDMIFISLGNCQTDAQNGTNSICTLNYFNEHRGYALRGENFAWDFVSAKKFGENSYEIVIERTKHFVCDDPFEISQDTIRMLFVTYQNSPLFSTLNEIENLIVRMTHLIDYYVPQKSTCGEDAICEG